MLGMVPLSAFAATVTMTDTTTTGTANTGYGHTFSLTTATEMSGGSFEIDLPSNVGFVLESGFSYTDLDLSFDTGSGPVDQTLHSYDTNPEIVGVGVSIITNTTPHKIVFSLATVVTPIAAGTDIVIKTGTDAVGGVKQIINSPFNGSHTFTFLSQNGAQQTLDSGTSTMTVTGGWGATHSQTSLVASADSDHEFTFTSYSDVPAGDLLFLAFPTAFTIPGTLDYTDVDLDIAGSPAPLASTAGAVNNGVSVFGPMDGYNYVMITLNSTSGLTSGQAIAVRIGLNAVDGTSGDLQIANTSQAGSVNYILMATTSDMNTNHYSSDMTETITSGASVPEFSTYMYMLTIGVGGWLVYQEMKKVRV